MIFYFIGLLALFSILFDGLICHQLKNRFSQYPWAKRLYLGSVIVVDIVIVIALLFYRKALNTPNSLYSILILWVIALFFMMLFPKAVYLLISTGDWLVSRWRHRKSRWFSRIGLVAALYLLGVMVWGASVGRNRIRVTEVEIRSEKIPPAFDGYRIAQISDLHLGNYSSKSTMVQRVADRILALHPDLVVNSGDLVNLSSRELTPQNMGILSRIQAPDGVVSVLGNHDLGFYMQEDSTFTPRQSVQQLIEKQQQMGWRMLQNETVYIRRGEDSISVSGVKYPLDGRHNGRDTGLGGCDLPATYRNVPDSVFNLMISHTPQNWDEIRQNTPADLTVSGHVHAMQIKLPCGERGWSPARWMYDRWTGLYEEGGKYLYVNDGIGYVMFPMRIGTRPEITLFVLRSVKP